ncbi:MAG: purine-nucleoside phosphorylase [Actinomycetota bacterium]
MSGVGPGDGDEERGAALVRSRTDFVPDVAVILGSGLGKALAALDAELELAYTALPGFPAPSVPGHEGRLVLGMLGGARVAGFLGRIHFYEGHAMSLVTLPARLSAALGARVLIVTAAVGALDSSLEPGSLVVCSDHLNLLGENPLRGWRDADGRPAFVDLSTVYDPGLQEAAVAAAKGVGLPVARGVYAAMSGPTYETPAEVEFLRRAGASVVGMSMVPEATAATALGLRCLGLCCVTNVVGGSVTHEDVTSVASAFAVPFGALLEQVLEGVSHGK